MNAQSVCGLITEVTRNLTRNKKSLICYISKHPDSVQKIRLTRGSVNIFTPQQIVESNTFHHFQWTLSNCLLRCASLLQTPTSVSHNRRVIAVSATARRGHFSHHVPSTRKKTNISPHTPALHLFIFIPIKGDFIFCTP